MSDKIDMDFPIIETRRLKLRPLATGDVDAVYDLFSDEVLMRPYGMFVLENKACAIKFTDRLISDREVAVCLKAENLVVGTIGIVDYSKYNKRVEIAFELKEAYWNKGIMSEAVGAFINNVFEILDLNRMKPFIHPDNIASQSLLEKLGFEKEGLLKKRSLQRGVYQDLLIYGLLKS